MTKITSYNGKTKDELQKAADALRKEIHAFSQENAKHALKSTSVLRTKKDELARVLTAYNMIQFDVVKKESVRKTGKEEAK